MVSKSSKILVKNMHRHLAASPIKSQAEMARKMGLNRAMVNKWFTAEVIPSVDQIEDIAKLFHLETWELLMPESGSNSAKELEKSANEMKKLVDRITRLSGKYIKSVVCFSGDFILAAHLFF